MTGDPTAIADQFDAATKHAEETVAALRLNEMRRDMEHQDLPPTAMAFLANVVGDLDKIRHCLHAAASPMQIFITASAPGVGLCEVCFMHPEAVTMREEHAQTKHCESCGKLTDWFNEVFLQFGPIIVFGHWCEACKVAARP